MPHGDAPLAVLDASLHSCCFMWSWSNVTPTSLAGWLAGCVTGVLCERMPLQIFTLVQQTVANSAAPLSTKVLYLVLTDDAVKLASGFCTR